MPVTVIGLLLGEDPDTDPRKIFPDPQPCFYVRLLPYPYQRHFVSQTLGSCPLEKKVWEHVIMSICVRAVRMMKI